MVQTAPNNMAPRNIREPTSLHHSKMAVPGQADFKLLMIFGSIMSLFRMPSVGQNVQQSHADNFAAKCYVLFNIVIIHNKTKININKCNRFE